MLIYTLKQRGTVGAFPDKIYQTLNLIYNVGSFQKKSPLFFQIPGIYHRIDFNGKPPSPNVKIYGPFGVNQVLGQSGHSPFLDDDKDGAKCFEDFYHTDAWMPLNCSQQNGLSYNFPILQQIVWTVWADFLEYSLYLYDI